MAEAQRIGVISDTHGLMRPEALAHLQGSALILHGGDVGKMDVLERLREIAPVVAVRGNVDCGDTGKLPATEAVEFAGHWFYILHDLAELDLDPQAAGFSAVVYGHSHEPSATRHNGVLYFNPGSAGPKRFRLPICLGQIETGDAGLDTRIISLDTTD
ncbi:MAG: metallophosphoesterase family protein [Candidatus Methylumidiphilus sp.]